MINWKVRIRNRTFWMTFLPAVLLLVQAVAAAFGWQVDLSETGERWLAVVNQVFVLLAILGIVNDPTTATLYDSDQALKYEVPKSKE